MPQQWPFAAGLELSEDRLLLPKPKMMDVLDSVAEMPLMPQLERTIVMRMTERAMMEALTLPILAADRLLLRSNASAVLLEPLVVQKQQFYEER